MNENNENRNNDFSYWVGRAVGIVIAACLAAIIIATTVRVVAWIL